MKSLIALTLSILYSTNTLAVCGLESVLIPRPIFPDRKGQLIYTCESAIQYESSSDESFDLCIFQSSSVPFYMAFYSKKPGRPGNFGHSLLDGAKPEELKTLMDSKTLRLSHDSRNLFGYGSYAELNINLQTGKSYYLSKSKYSDDAGFDEIFSTKTNTKEYNFFCKMYSNTHPKK